MMLPEANASWWKSLGQPDVAVGWVDPKLRWSARETQDAHGACGGVAMATMKLTDFWERMAAVFGPDYAASWARDYVLEPLGSRTVVQAIDAGIDTAVIWRAVCDATEVPGWLR